MKELEELEEINEVESEEEVEEVKDVDSVWETCKGKTRTVQKGRESWVIREGGKVANGSK